MELQTSSGVPSVSFHELIEAGIAYGWRESTRRAYDSQSYLQKFAPRRARGTTSGRNLAIADRLEAEGRMKSAGRQALGSCPVQMKSSWAPSVSSMKSLAEMIASTPS